MTLACGVWSVVFFIGWFGLGGRLFVDGGAGGVGADWDGLLRRVRVRAEAVEGCNADV